MKNKKINLEAFVVKSFVTGKDNREQARKITETCTYTEIDCAGTEATVCCDETVMCRY